MLIPARRLAVALLLSFLSLSLFAAERPKPVIVLGFDGVDARLVEQWMNEGKLPHLAKLRDEGTFRPLRPPIPAQTPVSWSTFSTGIDPGRTGIFDFLRRDPQTYMPVFAAFEEQTKPVLLGKANPAAFALVVFAVLALLAFIASRVTHSWIVASVGLLLSIGFAAATFFWVEKNIPSSRPGVLNRRQGIPMWKVAADAGLKARAIHVPVTFPAEPVHDGHMLSGLGVPDMSGRIGKPFFFTSELEPRGSGTNEFSIEVVQLEDNQGTIETTVVGPPNKLLKGPDYISMPMTLVVSPARNSVQIQLGEQRIDLKPGQWSGWADFEFKFSSAVKVRGISRFFLLSTKPEVRLYLSPINFDPRHLPPGMDISYPRPWAGQLAEKHGPFKTIGWAIDTWAVSEGFANEQVFWDDMTWTVDQYRNLLRDFLKEDDDLLVHCFEFPDRVGHILWRLVDTDHPAYDAELAAKWGNGLLKSYQIMDEIVGEAVVAAKKKDATLMILSDHGFASFRKSINYNTWLVQNGYLTLRSGVETKQRDLEVLFDQGEFWENVDWSKTRAYSMGLGNIYINLKGRESKGTVNPGTEYDALKLELKQKIEAIVDPANGERPVSRVYLREEAYREFDPNVIPDLFIGNSDGYRVSWQTSLGGVQKDLFQFNDNVWSGDHCSVDPELVKGIFFTNRKLTGDRQPYIADVYPTVLQLLGVKPPYRLDGVALE